MSEAISISRSWPDYLELCKPRVVLLMMLCTLAGMCLASPTLVAMELLVATLAGVALVAASAATVNHIADAEIDARMLRTSARPVATGRITSQQGGLFAAALGIPGLVLLYYAVNPLTAALNLACWVGYGLIYTLYLKRATPQNIVIGGLFGAAPPLFGWTAVTNSIDLEGVLLVLIIFVWTPPHFWALALDRKDEYRAANIPMLPVTHGDRVTRIHIFVYTLLLVACSLLPYSIGMSNEVYLVSALLLGGGFVFRSALVLQARSATAPAKTFVYSIWYLLLLFVALLVDHYV